jgi:uncharacterized membrane-anchored protein
VVQVKRWSLVDRSFLALCVVVVVLQVVGCFALVGAALLHRAGTPPIIAVLVSFVVVVAGFWWTVRSLRARFALSSVRNVRAMSLPCTSFSNAGARKSVDRP